jgi:hypothetical protein
MCMLIKILAGLFLKHHRKTGTDLLWLNLYILRELGFLIPDSTTATKEEGEKISCPTFFYSLKFYKIVN